MKKISADTNYKSLLYLKYFALAISILIFLAVSFRIFKLSQTSTFTHHYYAVLVQAPKPFVVSINTDLETISTLYFDAKLTQDIQNPEEATFKLLIPINALIDFKNQSDATNFSPGNFLSFSSLPGLIVRKNIFEYKKSNQYDVAKLYLLQKYSTLKNSQVTISKLYRDDVIDPTYKEFIEENLQDTEVFNEKVPVEIINASGKDGVGSTFSKILTLSGFNVVSVTSTRKPIAGSTITIRIPDNKTTERVEDMFSMPVTHNAESHLADISIVIGERYAEKILRVE